MRTMVLFFLYLKKFWGVYVLGSIPNEKVRCALAFIMGTTRLKKKGNKNQCRVSRQDEKANCFKYELHEVMGPDAMIFVF